MLGSVLVQKQRTCTTTRNDNVASAAILELLCKWNALFWGFWIGIKDTANLVVVRLDQEWLSLDKYPLEVSLE